MTMPPCKGCEDEIKGIGCHAVCKKYIAYKKQHDIERKAMKEAMPPRIYPSSFTGTTPKPGYKWRSRRKRK